MLGFSLIGTPNGFDILDFRVPEHIKLDSKVDLKNSEINVFPNTDVLKAYKEFDGNISRFYFVYYKFAQEINTSRSGSYYGSVIILENKYADANLIVKALLDLAEVIKEYCLDSNNRFHRPITGISFDIPESIKFLQLGLTDYNLNFSTKSQKSGFLPIGKNQDLKNYQEFISAFYDDESLAEYETLYASEHDDVSNVVKKLGVVPILSFSRLQEIRQQKITQLDNVRKKQEEEKRRSEEEAKILAEKQQKEKQKAQILLDQKKSGKPSIENLSAKYNELESALQRLGTRVQSLESNLQRFDKPVTALETKPSPPPSANPRKNQGSTLRKPSDDLSENRIILIGVGILILLIIFVFSWYYLLSESKVDINSNKSQINENVRTFDANNTDSIAKLTQPVISEKNLKLFTYKGNSVSIKTIRDLLENIKNKCLGSCSIDDNFKKQFADNLINSNPSAKLLITSDEQSYPQS